MTFLRKYLASTTAIGTLLIGMGVASETANAQIDEIIITATKRAASLQDVSVSVAAFNASAISDYGLEGGEKIADFVPNFAVQQTFGPGSPPFMAIRGINYIDFNFTNEMSVGTYLDEVYQGSQDAIVGQLFDQERVEVLRGPQGTLFGRNTTAGLVHYISAKPTDEFEGFARLQGGSFKQIIAEGAVSGPITEGFRARIAGKYNRDSGIRENLNPALSDSRFGQTNIFAIRGIAQLDITDTLMAELNVHYTDNESTASGASFYGTRLPSDPTSATLRCSVADTLDSLCVNASGFRDPNANNHEHYGFHDSVPSTSSNIGGYLKFAWDLDNVNLTSITGYEASDGLLIQDIFGDTGRLDAMYKRQFHQISQEVRLDGETDWLKWILGAFYYTDEKTAENGVFLAGSSDFTLANALFFSRGNATIDTKSWAVFAQGDVPLTDTLTLSGGVRYTDESRELADFRTIGGGSLAGARLAGVGDVDETSLTGRAALEWRPIDDLMLYFQYSRGFKSGGFNTANSITAGRESEIGPVNSEKVTNFEIGAKSEWFDGILRANVTVFKMKFSDLQTSATTNVGGNIFISTFLNIGDADIIGSEMEFTLVPNDRFDASLGVGLLDTEIDAPGITFTSPFVGGAPVPLTGKELQSAPSYNLNGAVRYHHPLDGMGIVTLQTDWRYQDSVFFGPDNNPFETQGAYGVVNFRVRWNSESEKYSAEAFVENATQTNYKVHGFQSASQGSMYLTGGRPRTFGVKVGVDF